MMTTLYNVESRIINDILKIIFAGNMPEQGWTIRNFRIVQQEGIHQVNEIGITLDRALPPLSFFGNTKVKGENKKGLSVHLRNP